MVILWIVECASLNVPRCCCSTLLRIYENYKSAMCINKFMFIRERERERERERGGDYSAW